jgi:hypothetical protein
MQLHGIATALYGTERRSTISVTNLVSEGPDEIFIEKTQKAEFDPSKPRESRDALGLVLDELAQQGPQRFVIGRGPNKDREAEVYTSIIYGTPEMHPAVAYRKMLLTAYPEYFRNQKNFRNKHVRELLERLFLKYHKGHGQPGSVIELNHYQLFLPNESLSCEITEKDQANEEFVRLQKAADARDREAYLTLSGYAREAAREYAKDLRNRGILEAARFVKYGLGNGRHTGTNRYTILGWCNMKNIFVEELTKHMKKPHNVCVKTPDDKPAPPFSDICATYLADQWDMVYEISKKRHVYARQPALVR